MSQVVRDIEEALDVLATAEKAEFLPRFFKTGKGEYGEGDVFIGVTVPDQRKVAKAFAGDIELRDLSSLLSSAIHEHRLTALLILILQFEKLKDLESKKIYIDFYLNHLPFVNNWDLVDSTAYKILGNFCYLLEDDSILIGLSKSENMWEKRIAVVATLFYIKKRNYTLTKEFVLRNLHHPHDLMHKANGWMLREIGKQDELELVEFLEKYYQKMPRTTLRYAIEKLDEDRRQDFLKGNI